MAEEMIFVEKEVPTGAFSDFEQATQLARQRQKEVQVYKRPVHKATIVPRGSALGMVTQLPDKDETSITRKQLLARLDVCMGGRVAEELIFGKDEVTTGALSDLQQATSLARHMVAECGMSDAMNCDVSLVLTSWPVTVLLSTRAWPAKSALLSKSSRRSSL